MPVGTGPPTLAGVCPTFSDAEVKTSPIATSVWVGGKMCSLCPAFPGDNYEGSMT